MQVFRRILLILPPGPSCRWALTQAAALAAAVQAPMTVLAFTGPHPRTGSRDQKSASPPGQCLSDLEPVLAELGVQVPIDCLEVTSRSLTAVIQTAQAGDDDLIIKPADAGCQGQPFGASADPQLLRYCPGAVCLVQPPGRLGRRILASLDFRLGFQDEAAASLNERILAIASDLALAELGELHLVHVWEAPGINLLRRWGSGLWGPGAAAEEMRYIEQVRHRHLLAMDTALAQLAKRLGSQGLAYLKPQTHLVRGSAIDEIPRLAAELATDLVIIGNRGRRGLAGLVIGNTPEAILGRLQCALLAIRPPDPRGIAVCT